jgi:hypothetical protein
MGMALSSRAVTASPHLSAVISSCYINFIVTTGNRLANRPLRHGGKTTRPVEGKQRRGRCRFPEEWL